MQIVHPDFNCSINIYHKKVTERSLTSSKGLEFCPRANILALHSRQLTSISIGMKSFVAVGCVRSKTLELSSIALKESGTQAAPLSSEKADLNFSEWFPWKWVTPFCTRWAAFVTSKETYKQLEFSSITLIQFSLPLKIFENFLEAVWFVFHCIEESSPIL